MFAVAEEDDVGGGAVVDGDGGDNVGVVLVAVFGSAALLVAAVLASSTYLLLLMSRRGKTDGSAGSRKKKTDTKNKKDPKRGEAKKGDGASSTTRNDAPASSSAAANANSSDDDGVCVWAERQKKGVAPASLHRRAGAGESKPYGSQYYYAHNNPNAIGGYSDGLRMEDFQMNKPRLLSRGGAPVVAKPNADGNNSEDGVEEKAERPVAAVDTASSSIGETARKSRPVLSITKYLWDDSGDASGVATIRIDKLPGTTSSNELIDYRDAGVIDVSSKLLSNSSNGGLLVTIRTETGVDYELRIDNLYGRVSEVRTTTAKGKKRLLVRLTKAKSSSTTSGFFGSTKFEAWPHPQQRKG